jgi:hypothetical protein
MRRKRFAAGTVVLGVLLLVGLATGLTLFSERGGARNADAASPAQTFYVEGTIYSDDWECGCELLLEAGSETTYHLFGDLGGFSCGDRVAVWATSCEGECLSICMQGDYWVTVENIVGLPDPPTPAPPTPADPVGGIAEIPGVAEGGSLSRSYVALMGVVGGVLVALTTGAWYARRRWLR